jgi:uncharacterized membrane protein YbhN (UPF0104 family)
VLDKLKSLWPKFRYVLSLLLLAWLFQRVHWTEIVPKKPGMFNLLVLAVIIGVAAVLLSILRWQRVLVALGKPTRLSVLARYYFAAMFVSNFVPSTVALRKVGAPQGKVLANG